MKEYICNECKTFFEGKRIHKCPECKSTDTRLLESYTKEEGMPSIILKGMDFHHNRVKARKWATQGMDKDTANEFYKTHIKASKTRIAQSPYKRMDLTEQGAKELGMKRVSDSEADKRRATAKRLGPEIQKRLTRK